MNVRKITEKDWDTLVSWWDAWPEWTAPHKDVLPENGTGGVMVEKDGVSVAACFIYTTNSKTAWIEWVVSNPDYKDKDRGELIENLLKAAEEVCRNMGNTFILSVGRNTSLVNKHKKLGWIIEEKPVYEMLKFLK